MKKCELCGQQARMFCESDQANLCWDCDEKVHCANFLVAKHSRSLLCHACQSPTPWTASGRKLTPTVSVCEGCVEVHGGKCEQGGYQERRRDNEDEVDDGNDFEHGEGFESYEGGDSEEDDDDDDDDDEEDEEEDEEDEDGENQVVPWSCASSSSSPPPPTVTSSSEGEISAGAGVASKRMREYSVDLDSDDEIECSSAQQGTRPFFNDEATSSSSLRPVKKARVPGTNQSASIIPDDACKAELKSTAVVRSIQRLQNRLPTDINDASKMIFGICKMSRDQNR